MSILSHPTVARSAARLLQLGAAAASGRMARSAAARLTDVPGRTEHLAVPTSFGPASVTLYRPDPGDHVPPVHVNLPGGGYVMALTAIDDPLCRSLAAQAGAVVLNVDYVVAPQHPFPAAAHQVHELLSWVEGHGPEHGWDGGRMTVGGQSAGGGLAAAGARLALERRGPAIALQVLHYPPLDLTVPGAAKRSVVSKPVLRPWTAEVFDTAYVPDPVLRADRLASPAAPADDADLTGIAPAVVIAAEYDILRDEARRYADRLEAAGSLIEYLEVRGADHGYDLKDDRLARETYAAIAAHLRRATSA